MRKIQTLFVLAVASLAFSTAQAHGNTKPLHGGVMQMVGEMSFELVTRPDGAEVYVVDDGEDVASAELSGKLMVANGDARSEAALQPAGGNKFEAKGVKIASGSKVAVILVGKDKVSKTTAHFTIK